jgi:hypothetical protein
LNTPTAISSTLAVTAILAGIVLVGATRLVYPHEATNVLGFPLGWKYDAGCCRSAEEPGGDCAPIASQYVEERADGYHINLPVGAHPRLIKKGYSGVVPYGVERRSPEGNYHICLTTDGTHRFCFYAGARGF